MRQSCALSLGHDKFWWHVQDGKNHYYCPKSWSAPCKPKKDGGLCFKQFKDINIFLLTKLTWKVNIETKALWVKCLFGKYIKQNEFLNSPNIKGSWAWNEIKLGKKLIKQCFTWIVGFKLVIKALKSKWLSEAKEFISHLRLKLLVEDNLSMVDLMLPN